jgi:LmbE family N-acetylglucosaminyl deacetylase
MCPPGVALPGRNPLLIVSPHPDDAVLSCWALLSRSEPVDVFDVFAGSPQPPQQGTWDRRCGFADSAESSRARKQEELRALDGTPHRVRFLELVNVDYVDGRRDPADAGVIAAEVREWLSRNDGGTVALPAGAGWTMSRLRRGLGEHVWWRFIGERPGPPRQPDHVFARDAGLEAVAGTRAPVILYEETPYLWGARADRAVASLGRPAEPLELPVDRAEKARRIAAYTSQIEHISPPQGRLDDPAVLPAGERYWLLR